jgi:hypothetical protein
MPFSDGCSFSLGHEFEKDYKCDIGIGTLIFQTDGNLVVYDSDWEARWSSGTAGRGDRALFQSDGNLVVYNAAWQPLWSSGTVGRGKYLIFQPNRDLVINDDGDKIVWSTGTYVSGKDLLFLTVCNIGR